MIKHFEICLIRFQRRKAKKGCHLKIYIIRLFIDKCEIKLKLKTKMTGKQNGKMGK